MAYDIDNLIESIRESRRFFLKHIEGLRDDQWDWKPYPQCKSIRQTLAHMVIDDRVCLERLRTDQPIEYNRFREDETDVHKLLGLLDASHEEFCRFLKGRFESAQLDTEVLSFTGMARLADAIQVISTEDYYHAGQVAFIRLATDPSWDYYAQVYGVSS